MDPLTLSTSFATIVGLLCNYVGERRADASKTYEDFLLWLLEKQHTEVREMIEHSQGTSEAIKGLLREGQGAIIDKLNAMDNVLASVASHLEYFCNIALAARPGVKLSDQALQILQCLTESGGSKMMEIDDMGDVYHFLVLDGNGTAIDITEHRFIEDDLNSLCELGFLRLDYSSDRSRVFHLTRQAVAYVAAVHGGA